MIGTPTARVRTRAVAVGNGPTTPGRKRPRTCNGRTRIFLVWAAAAAQDPTGHAGCTACRRAPSHTADRALLPPRNGTDCPPHPDREGPARVPPGASLSLALAARSLPRSLAFTKSPHPPPVRAAPVAAASEQGKAAPPAGPPRAARPRLASARRPPAVLPGHSRSTVEVGAGSLRGGAVGGVGPRRGFPALRCASSPSARMPPNAHQVHPSFAPTPPPPPRAPRAPRLKAGGRATEETDDSRSVTRGRVRCKTRI